MRPIKFRIWDIRNNKFNLPHRDYSIYDLVNNTQELRSDEKYIYQQFTGLKDKNGKEIWEGDILLCRDLQMNEKYNRNREVIYNEYMFMVKDGWPPYSCFENSEIVGNIFENPELL